MIELIIIGGGILLGLVGFIIGLALIARAYKESPSIAHYKRVVDILTLRKLWSKKAIPHDIVTDSKKDHIKHYEDMRDKLTIRKKTKLPEEESGGGGGGIIANIIGGFIAIFIGVTLFPVVSKQVQMAQQSTNVTSPATTTILNMLPFFFGFVIISIALMTIFQSLRSAGIV